MHPKEPLSLAIVGAGPVGLALALFARLVLPEARLTLFDARSAAQELRHDPRTLALSLGSVQFLERLGVWPAASAAPIREVQVSQAPPSPGGATVRLRAAELGVPMLGAVLPYGPLVAAMQAAWLERAAAEPQRLASRFGAPVGELRAGADAAVLRVQGAAEAEVERFDIAVVAEGGVFAEQARKPLTADYAQTAWVGSVVLEGAAPGLAIERFTRAGPAALLPLPAEDGAAPGRTRAALVWCVARADDPVPALDDGQRITVLNQIFPAAAGRVVGISALKGFALGLNAERTLVHGLRIVRIGNAAQTLHPVAGQGLNLGLRDVHALASALRGPGEPLAALARVGWQRAPDRLGMIAATDFLARSFTWQLPGAGLLRGAGLAALEALPPAKAWLARQMMFGWR